ncbi:MAG: hypothetical protein M3282_03165 [Gemmatimonadota bacterium]|nr:hypothetical protein [Gemmatimonadota bacterium]
MTDARLLLRHTLATLAYRGGKVLRDAPLGFTAEVIFQGPIADALTHVGQLAMLRRLAGSPVRGENYAKAHIVSGRVGMDQAPPRAEFG